jgi:hypothetical protein
MHKYILTCSKVANCVSGEKGEEFTEFKVHRHDLIRREDLVRSLL